MISDEQKEKINHTTRGYAKRNMQRDFVPSEPHQLRFWKIEEAVGDGKYIILPGIYNNQQDCKKAFPVDSHCRAVEYAQGCGNRGAMRVGESQ